MYFMLRNVRHYCKVVNLSNLENNTKKCKLNFKELKHKSKVPKVPVTNKYTIEPATSKIHIDTKLIQLLERLSLVGIDDAHALEILENSIKFAQCIENIPTDGIEPLYTVLEWQNLSLREDIVTEGNCREEILRNAKVTDEDYFVAPPGNIPLEQEEKDFKKSY